MENIIDREVAWRIFALEFNRSNLYFSEGDERAPNYIITPTGVKCNRLFVVGVVTEIENIGSDNSLWRARIADPTGVFTVYAGQYQPEAAIFLSELNVPAYVAVVGKARRYEPEEGSVYTSIRPEEINHADEKLRDRWVLDTAERTLERIRLIEDALKLGISGNDLREHLLKRGTNATLADGAVRAIQHYKNLNTIIAELKNALIHAVELISSDAEQPVEEQFIEKKKETQMNADEHRSQEQSVELPEQSISEIEKAITEPKEIATEPESIPEPSITEAPIQIEPKDVLADIINRLDTGKGTSYSNVVEAAVSAGIDADSVEASIKELMDEGRCYEPRIGVLRKV